MDWTCFPVFCARRTNEDGDAEAGLGNTSLIAMARRIIINCQSFVV